MPKSWVYDSFLEDIDDEEPKTIALFIKEVELIYKEEREFELRYVSHERLKTYWIVIIFS